jgi:thiol-disulfide isomerase/thioredoxin
MRPVVDRLEENYAGRVTFAPMNVDTDEGQVAMRKYGVTGTPTLLITNANGTVLFRRSGGTTYALLKEAIETALKIR